MFFILKLILIILLNETYAHISYITQNTEIILLPAWNLASAKKISLTLKIFGKLIQLNLHRNDWTVSPAFKVWKYNANDVIIEKLSLLKASDCFYHHEDHISSAVVNFCEEHGLEGFVFVGNDILEIRPLRNDFAPLNLINDICVGDQINLSFGKPHLIKRSLQYLANSKLYHLDNFKPKQRYVRNTQQKLTMELAIFIDETAYNVFMPLLDNDKEKLHNMILAYVNGIQTVFHHPSLGVSIDISLVYLEIMEEQPLNLPVFDDFNKLLNSFCKYATFRNPPDDNDPRHWDIGLYLTGIDFYENMDGEKGFIWGASKYNGLCEPFKSCAIIKFGDTSYIEKLSLGFASFLTAAHEIGHLLGMEHDFLSENSKICPRYKHLMSPIRLHRGQITWAKCNRYIAEELWETKECLRDHTRPENPEDAYAFDHSRHHDLPGREWTAKAQCELFMRDKNANVVTLHDICQILQCETPHKNEFAGPVLDGTYCGHGKECRSGKCVPVLEPPYIFKYCEIDNWSEWKEESCKSNCLENSKGVLVKRRICKHGTYTKANCEGLYYDIVLCNNSLLCDRNRKTIDEFTTMKCTEFSKKVFKLDEKPGWQAPHDVEKPWVACTIFCQQKGLFSYYDARLELLDFGINPYFPDGTWCHNKDGQDYYCRKHYCLPEHYSFEE